MTEPVWVREDVVQVVHRRQLAEHGGSDGVRDADLLDSALNKPLNLYHYGSPQPDLAALAASYAYGIARNHPFVDGNKRTAFIICRLFLKLNGQDIQATGAEKYQTVIKLASGQLSEGELAQWLRDHMAAL